MDTPREAVERGLHAVSRAVVANVLLAGTKLAAGFLGNSYALVADGVESSSDVVSSILVYVGLKTAGRPADANHPYGHGKAEPLTAIVVACALLAAAALIAVQSIEEIRRPHELPAPFTLVVLVGVVAIKSALARYTSGVATSIESGAVHTDAAHHFSDAITSALAFVGISIALWRRLPQADDWAALVAVPVIVFTAVRQMRAPIAELLDTTPPFVEERVRQVAATVPGVRALDKCLVRKVGFVYYVDLHVKVDANIPVRDGHAIAHRVQQTVREHLPRVAGVLVHIEPDESIPD